MIDEARPRPEVLVAAVQEHADFTAFNSIEVVRRGKTIGPGRENKEIAETVATRDFADKIQL